MKKKIGIALLIVAFFLLILLAFNGAFASVSVKKGTDGGYRIAGYYHKGPYQNIGTAFGKVSQITEKAFGKPSNGGEDCVFPGGEVLGLYFDAPGSKPEDSLLSFASVIYQRPEDSIALRQADPSIVFLSIPQGDAYYCDLKTSGMLSMIIAAMKAYPALGEFAKANPPKDSISHVFEVYREGYTRFVMRYPKGK